MANEFLLNSKVILDPKFKHFWLLGSNKIHSKTKNPEITEIKQFHPCVRTAGQTAWVIRKSNQLIKRGA
jgi:hypothetical protein